MFRYRTNTLGLRWKNRFSAGAVEETVEHFVVECGGLREVRGVNASVGVEEALLYQERTEEGVERYTKMLDEMLRERGRLIWSWWRERR